MRREDHVVITKITLGEGYDDVHKWIDALAGPFFRHGCPYMHWVKRHNLQALREKYDEDSPEYLAGMFHIQCDLLSHFRTFVPTPETEADVQQILRGKGRWREDCKWLLDKDECWLETEWRLRRFME